MSTALRLAAPISGRRGGAGESCRGASQWSSHRSASGRRARADRTLLPLLGFVAAHRRQRVLRRGRVRPGHRRPGGDRPAGRGRRRRPPATVRRALRELSFQLSGAQLGITITALLTGYLAEPALAQLFAPAAAPRSARRRTGSPRCSPWRWPRCSRCSSASWCRRTPRSPGRCRAALATAGPMRVFSRIFGWLIRALNGSANWLVRRLGVEPQEELASARSPEELGLLAAYLGPGRRAAARRPPCCCGAPSASATSGPPRR